MRMSFHRNHLPSEVTKDNNVHSVWKPIKHELAQKGDDDRQCSGLCLATLRAVLLGALQFRNFVPCRQDQ
eukprot:2877356-Amphidinium_carterae.2